MKSKSLVLLVLLLAANCFAGDVHLVVGGNGDWNDSNSWDVGRVPEADDNVFIDLLNLCDINEPAEANNLYLGVSGIGSLSVYNRLDVRNDIILGINFGSLGILDVFSLGEVTADCLKVGQVGYGSVDTFGGRVYVSKLLENNKGGINLQSGLVVAADYDRGQQGNIAYLNGLLIIGNYLPGDLDGNGRVNLRDWAIMAENWLRGPVF